MTQDGFFTENGCLKRKGNTGRLEDLSVPDGIISIDYRCFADSPYLRTIFIPDSVKEVGVAAFSGCRKLETVRLPLGLVRIRKELFLNCESLEEVVIPQTVTTIGEWAFRGCRKLKRIFIPDSVREICAEVFVDCPVRLICAGEAGNPFIQAAYASGEEPEGIPKAMDISGAEDREDNGMIAVRQVR